MNSELKKALETITSSITELRDSNRKLWMTVETMRVRLDALEDSGEDIDPDVLESINALQYEDATLSQAQGHKTPSNGTDPLYNKAIMVVRGSADGVLQKDLQSILGCSSYRLAKIREKMVADGIAFNPPSGKIYSVVDGRPVGTLTVLQFVLRPSRRLGTP